MEENVAVTASDSPWTWRDRLRRRLFPAEHCFAPEAPAEFKDCITLRSVSRFTWIERLRLMWTGIVVTHARIVTENEVGDSRSAAVCYVGTKRDLRHQ